MKKNIKINKYSIRKIKEGFLVCPENGWINAGKEDMMYVKHIEDAFSIIKKKLIR